MFHLLEIKPMDYKQNQVSDKEKRLVVSDMAR